MRVTTIDRFTPRPGPITRWRVDLTDAPWVTSSVPPSFNQRFHLAGARTAPPGETVFLAGAFDVDGPLDHKALERAFTALVERHDTLRCGFVARDDPDGGVEIVRRVHDVRRMRLLPDPPIETTTSDDARATVRHLLADACTPLGEPDHFFAAVDRLDRSTVLCGFDHAHVDAWSIAVVVDDLRMLYEGYRCEPGAFDPARLGPVGSFLAHCAEEADDDRDHAALPAMDDWRTFFARHGNTPPSFPGDLGLEPGATAPQAVDLRGLADATAADRVDAACRALGGSTFAGVLAAMAHAARDVGLGDELSLLFPMHTRRAARRETAVGWFTTNAPLTVRAHRDLADTVAATGTDLRAAVGLGAIPIGAVVDAVGGLTFVRSDVFMVSYVDYRRLPGAAHHTGLDAHHISNVTRADDVQIWISRTEEGLALRTRLPDTPAAHRVVGRFLDAVVAITARLSSGPASG
ncbi:condensation domain-containing protein [uncultured Williamsia sp.]|uniref:condensation domain-containing protein n=1 Tax=uncultured Williamsia sp. TaxID=259311 RepID=UPI002623AB3E|nr:condensation domain-containing protein [uncultured Williamsia sp.]